MDIYTSTKKYLDGCSNKELVALAAVSDVPYTTILKIRSGETKNPGVLTIQKLYKAIPTDDGKNRRKLVYGRRESDNGRRRKVIKPE